MTSPIVLDPFTAADFGRLIAWVLDAESLMQWAGPRFRWPLDEQQLALYLAGAEGPTPERVVFKARLADGASLSTRAGVDVGLADPVIGHVELNNLDPENGSATLSRVLIGPREARGLGLGEHLVAVVVDHGFRDLGLHRIDLGVFDFNQAAIRCYERVGFRREGLLRDSRRMGESYWSLIVMALLEDEWRRGREEM